MLSSTVRLGGRSLRSVASRRFAQFSTVPATEEKKEEGGFLSNLSPLYAIPTGIILGIPIIQNEVLILNEETQLVACFAAFVITAYTKGGDAIGASLDDKAAAIQKEHNLIEDSQIEAVQAVIDGHKARLTLHDDLKSISDHSKAMLVKASEAYGKKLSHARRDDVERQLAAVYAKETQSIDRLSGDLTSAATASVRASFAADEKAQKAALDNAVATLQGKAAGADPVQGLFQGFFKDFAAERTKAMKGETTLSAETLQAVQDEVEALAKKEGLVGKVDLPKFDAKVKLSEM